MNGFDAFCSQDFFGVIEELRIWRVVRTARQIRLGMEADDGRGPGMGRGPGVGVGAVRLSKRRVILHTPFTLPATSLDSGGFTSPGLPDPHHPDLVAYWKFDEGQGYLAKWVAMQDFMQLPKSSLSTLLLLTHPM